MNRTTTDTPGVGTETVDLSLRLLEFLARSAEPMGLSELARQFEASKATLYRHLQTLAHHGFVRQEAATLRYTAGIAVPPRRAATRAALTSSPWREK
jgi:DNA-binding IclR family transcriptional regulator